MTNAPMIIGITGNIATGKSVVGHMLANSGGLQIDADVVANRMLYPDGPSYRPAIETFGRDILTADGAISRKKLGKIVFSNPEKLQILEGLIHPAVTSATKKRIELTSQPLVAVEAIKLLESSLVDICDAVWVSHASVDHQIERLLTSRNLSKEEALSRIRAQPSQVEKLNRANVVINTEGSFKETWHQIQDALNDTIQIEKGQKKSQQLQAGDWVSPNANALEKKELEEFWQTWAEQNIDNLYASMGSNILLPFIKESQLQNMLFWDNWNFSASPSKWISKTSESVSSKRLIEIFESQVKGQLCEVILLSNKMALEYPIDPGELGFAQVKLDNLAYQAWQEAAARLSPDHEEKIWVKILNQPVETKLLNDFETNDK